MSSQQEHPRSVLEWASVGKALGDTVEGKSGDLGLVVDFENGALVAAIDGLGHGTEAAFAAKTAGDVLRTHASESVLSLIQRCHEQLRHTRGAVVTLASFNASNSSLTWIAVGNVDGVLLRANPMALPVRESISMRGGIVGYRLPPLRAATLDVLPGDTLILTTDGIRSGFAAGLALDQNPQKIADAILTHHGKVSDDALVLVARYLGVS